MSAIPRIGERSFGRSVGAVCVLIALIGWWRHRMVLSTVAGSLGAILLLLAWLRPTWLRVPSALWSRLAHALGWINTRIVLTIVHIAVFTPVGLALRAAGWDALRLKRQTGSGWLSYPERIRNPKHYDRMF